jgi:hypothetical protein
MNRKLTMCIAAIALAAVPLSSQALGKNEKGCLVGGAAAGCAVGTVVAKNKAKKDDAARENERKRYAHNSSRDSRKRQVEQQ